MKNLIAALVALVVSAHAFGQTLQDAQREMESENYFRAKQILFKLMGDGTSDKNEISYYLGNAYLKTDDADSAKVFYQKVNSPDSKNAFNYLAKGRLALLQKNVAEAKTNFDNALKVTKFKNANIFFEVGDAYFRPTVTDIDAAISNLKSAKDLDANNTSVHLALGDALLIKNPQSGGDAMNEYQAARDVNKNLSIAYVKEGRLDMNGQIYDQAIDAFKKALAIDEKYPVVHKELGEAYYLTKNYDKMIDEFQKYVTFSPGDTKARIALLEMLFRNKAYDKCADEATKALKTDPNNLDYMRFLFYSDLELKRYKEGQDVANNFFASPNAKPKPRDYVYGARLAAATNDTVRGTNYFKVALENDSANCELITEYAKYLFNIMHYQDGLKEYAVKKDRGCEYKALDYYYMGRAYIFLEDWANADTTFATYISKSPNTPEGYYYRAQTNIHIGKPADYNSYPYYEKYIELAAANTQRYKNGLIEAYQFMSVYTIDKLKDKAKAKDYLNKSLELDPGNQFSLDALKQIK